MWHKKWVWIRDCTLMPIGTPSKDASWIILNVKKTNKLLISLLAALENFDKINVTIGLNMYFIFKACDFDFLTLQGTWC